MSLDKSARERAYKQWIESKPTVTIPHEAFMAGWAAARAACSPADCYARGYGDGAAKYESSEEEIRQQHG